MEHCKQPVARGSGAKAASMYRMENDQTREQQRKSIAHIRRRMKTRGLGERARAQSGAPFDAGGGARRTMRRAARPGNQRDEGTARNLDLRGTEMRPLTAAAHAGVAAAAPGGRSQRGGRAAEDLGSSAVSDRAMDESVAMATAAAAGAIELPRELVMQAFDATTAGSKEEGADVRASIKDLCASLRDSAALESLAASLPHLQRVDKVLCSIENAGAGAGAMRSSRRPPPAPAAAAAAAAAATAAHDAPHDGLGDEADRLSDLDDDGDRAPETDDGSRRQSAPPAFPAHDDGLGGEADRLSDLDGDVDHGDGDDDDRLTWVGFEDLLGSHGVRLRPMARTDPQNPWRDACAKEDEEKVAGATSASTSRAAPGDGAGEAAAASSKVGLPTAPPHECEDEQKLQPEMDAQDALGGVEGDGSRASFYRTQHSVRARSVSPAKLAADAASRSLKQEAASIQARMEKMRVSISEALEAGGGGGGVPGELTREASKLTAEAGELTGQLGRLLAGALRDDDAGGGGDGASAGSAARAVARYKKRELIQAQRACGSVWHPGRVVDVNWVDKGEGEMSPGGFYEYAVMFDVDDEETPPSKLPETYLRRPPKLARGGAAQSQLVLTVRDEAWIKLEGKLKHGHIVGVRDNNHYDVMLDDQRTEPRVPAFLLEQGRRAAELEAKRRAVVQRKEARRLAEEPALNGDGGADAAPPCTASDAAEAQSGHGGKLVAKVEALRQSHKEIQWALEAIKQNRDPVAAADAARNAMRAAKEEKMREEEEAKAKAQEADADADADVTAQATDAPNPESLTTQRLAEELRDVLREAGARGESVENTFKRFDADGNGVITFEEMEAGLKELGFEKGDDPESNAELQDLMRMFDDNQNDMVSLREFIRFVRDSSVRETVARKTQRSRLKAVKIDPFTADDLLSAAFAGDAERVCLILERTPDLNNQADVCEAACRAARRDNVSVLQMLLERDFAKANSEMNTFSLFNGAGFSAAGVAAYYGSRATLRWLARVPRVNLRAPAAVRVMRTPLQPDGVKKLETPLDLAKKHKRWTTLKFITQLINERKHSAARILQHVFRAGKWRGKGQLEMMDKPGAHDWAMSIVKEFVAKDAKAATAAGDDGDDGDQAGITGKDVAVGDVGGKPQCKTSDAQNGGNAAEDDAAAVQRFLGLESAVVRDQRQRDAKRRREKLAIERQISAILKVHNPKLHGDLDKLLSRFNGREADLLSKVEARYGLRSAGFKAKPLPGGMGRRKLWVTFKEEQDMIRRASVKARAEYMLEQSRLPEGMTKAAERHAEAEKRRVAKVMKEIEVEQQSRRRRRRRRPPPRDEGELGDAKPPPTLAPSARPSAMQLSERAIAVRLRRRWRKPDGGMRSALFEVLVWAQGEGGTALLEGFRAGKADGDERQKQLDSMLVHPFVFRADRHGGWGAGTGAAMKPRATRVELLGAERDSGEFHHGAFRTRPEEAVTMDVVKELIVMQGDVYQLSAPAPGAGNTLAANSESGADIAAQIGTTLTQKLRAEARAAGETDGDGIDEVVDERRAVTKAAQQYRRKKHDRVEKAFEGAERRAKAEKRKQELVGGPSGGERDDADVAGVGCDTEPLLGRTAGASRAFRTVQALLHALPDDERAQFAAEGSTGPRAALRERVDSAIRGGFFRGRIVAVQRAPFKKDVLGYDVRFDHGERHTVTLAKALAMDWASAVRPAPPSGPKATLVKGMAVEAKCFFALDTMKEEIDETFSMFCDDDKGVVDLREEGML